MAKTIKQSIVSLEYSESSLKKSLEDCKASLLKKGVTLYTGDDVHFGVMSLLIDQINTNKLDLTVVAPRKNICSTLYCVLQQGDTVKSTGSSSSGSIRFNDLPKDMYSLRYKDSPLTSLSDKDYLFIDDDPVLRPATYIIVFDYPEKVSSVWLETHFDGSGKEFLKKEGNVWIGQVYRSGFDYFGFNYADSSTVTYHCDIHNDHDPEIHLIQVYLNRRRYTQYVFSDQYDDTFGEKSF